jgi:hypothetical protein
MEIKRSPSVARPVEGVKARPRWILIVVIIAIVLLLIGGVFAAYWFFSSRSTEPSTSTNQANTTDNQSTPTEPTQEDKTGLPVKKAPQADDLQRVVYGRFTDLRKEESKSEGDKDYEYSVSLAESVGDGELDEEEFISRQLDEGAIPIEGWVAPNGDLIAIREEADKANNKPQRLFVRTISGQGETTVIEGDSLDMFGTPIWSQDSKLLIYASYSREEVEGQTQSNVSLVAFDVEKGQAITSERAEEEREGLAFVPKFVRGDELFVVRAQPDVEDAGELGVITIASDGKLDGDFEKIMDVPIAVRGYDVSYDGKQIILARGSGGNLGADIQGPFILELFDRATGEVEELRESPSERYSQPLFSHDDSAIFYGAVSGLWKIDLESGDRTQLIASDMFDGTVELSPVSVRPDDGRLLLSVDYAPRTELMLIDSDAEEAAFEDLGDLAASDQQESFFFGWTE